MKGDAEEVRVAEEARRAEAAWRQYLRGNRYMRARQVFSREHRGGVFTLDEGRGGVAGQWFQLSRQDFRDFLKKD